MIKKQIAALAVTAALGLSVGLVGCAGADGGTAGTASDATSSVTDDKGASSVADGTEVKKDEKKDKKDKKKDDGDSKKQNLLSAAGYQGKLADGKSFLYIGVGSDTAMVSLTDEAHEGDAAETYSGKVVKDESGKTTVTDDDSGKSITFTLTENEDGSMDVDVEGHGKGNLQGYEGNLFSVIGSLADDDAKAEEAEATGTADASSTGTDTATK